MKKIFIIPAIAVASTNAFASDNFISRFWNESTPYAEASIMTLGTSSMIIGLIEHTLVMMLELVLIINKN